MSVRKHIYNGVNLDGSLPQVLERAEESSIIAGVFNRRRAGCEKKFGIDFEWFVKLHLDLLQIESQEQNGRIGKQAVSLIKSLGVLMGYYPEKTAEEADKEALDASYKVIREDLDRYLEEHKRDY